MFVFAVNKKQSFQLVSRVVYVITLNKVIMLIITTALIQPCTKIQYRHVQSSLIY